MKRYLTSIVSAAVLAFSSGAAFAENASVARVSLLSAPFGTGSYVLAAALQDISNKSASNVKIDASESPGFLYNIKELATNADARKTTIVGSGKGVLALATAGDKPFKKKYAPLKLIANYELVSVWLATAQLPRQRPWRISPASASPWAARRRSTGPSNGKGYPGGLGSRRRQSEDFISRSERSGVGAA